MHKSSATKHQQLHGQCNCRLKFTFWVDHAEMAALQGSMFEEPVYTTQYSEVYTVVAYEKNLLH